MCWFARDCGWARCAGRAWCPFYHPWFSLSRGGVFSLLSEACHGPGRACRVLSVSWLFRFEVLGWLDGSLGRCPVFGFGLVRVLFLFHFWFLQNAFVCFVFVCFWLWLAAAVA